MINCTHEIFYLNSDDNITIKKYMDQPDDFMITTHGHVETMKKFDGHAVMIATNFMDEVSVIYNDYDLLTHRLDITYWSDSYTTLFNDDIIFHIYELYINDGKNHLTFFDDTTPHSLSLFDNDSDYNNLLDNQIPIIKRFMLNFYQKFNIDDNLFKLIDKFKIPSLKLFDQMIKSHFK